VLFSKEASPSATGIVFLPFSLPIDLRPAQRDAVRPRPRKARVDALHDHVPFELREGSRHGEQELPLRRCRVEHLFVYEEVHLAAFQVADRVE